MIPISFIPAKRRVRRKRAAWAVTAAEPGLVLVAGLYKEQEWVRLSFDRAIDIAAIDVTQIVVLDGFLNEKRWIGSGTATLVGPDTVQVPLVEDGAVTGPDAVLDASAGTGIVAVDDGAAWAGVSGFVLSYV